MTKRFSLITGEVATTLLLSSATSAVLLVIRIVASGTGRFSFLLWNLFLAWLPLFFAYLWHTHLKKHGALQWQSMVLFGLWLGFLPNSFYLISDYIHIQSSGEVSLLYDVAMLMSFVLNGLLLGYISLFFVHRELQRLMPRYAHHSVAAILLSASFAIYLGRYLRWNSWDLVFNPFALLFDISDRFINPTLHTETFTVTTVFFVLLGSVYVVIYRLVGVIAAHNRG